MSYHCIAEVSCCFVLAGSPAANSSSSRGTVLTQETEVRCERLPGILPF